MGTENDDDDQDDVDDSDAGSGTDDGLKKALRRERLARRDAERKASEARAALDEARKGSGGDTDKLSALEERVAKAEERAEKAELKSLRAEVAEEKGLTIKQAKRLVGTTREELEDDADELVDDLGIKKTSKGKAGGSGTDTGDDDNSGSDDDGKTTTNGDDAGRGRSKPKEKLRGGASPESSEDRSGEEQADEIWKRTHGGI